MKFVIFLVSYHCCNTDYSGIPCKVAGLVERGSQIGQLNINQYDLSIDQKSTSTGSLYALVAAHEALQHSGWAMKSEEDKLKTGLYLTCFCFRRKQIFWASNLRGI